MIPRVVCQGLAWFILCFYWNSQLWISSFSFFCLQIHLFNIRESSVWVLIHRSLSLPAEKEAKFGSPTFDIPRLSIGLTPHTTPFSLPQKFVSPCSLFANKLLANWNACGADLGMPGVTCKRFGTANPWFLQGLCFSGGDGQLCLTRCSQVQNLWGEFPELSLLSPSQLWG